MVTGLYVLLMAGCWAAWVGGAAGQSPYCSFTPQHTLCRSSGLGSRCGQQVQGIGVGAQEAAAILALHNQLRSRVAMGLEARGAPGPQPSAANMRVMVWDDELATVAQGHANQCIFEHECSDCRRVARFGVGQNLFISFQSNLDKRVQWGRAIRAWYDEVADFSSTNVDKFQFSAAVGHYTQMLWWNSERVGCGFTMFREDGWWKKLYTCNYGPAGNILFSTMYRRGTPCSHCPRGTSCSLNYPGLCGSTFAPSLTTNQVGLGGVSIPTSPLVSTLIGAPVRPGSPSRLQEGEIGEEEGEMFVPFFGRQPKSSDLMPFLERAGMNTQVIRTSSLSNVQGIIRALPRGTRPIVLFRTSAGQLRELDPRTLAPLRRFGRSTTTRGPRTNTLDYALLACDLDISPCEVTSVGGNWTVGNSDSEGRYAEAQLSEGEGAQVVVEPLVKAPSSGAVCVALSHRRTLLPVTDTINTNTTLPPIQVGVMPLGGEVTRRPVLGAPGIWEMSRVTFRDLKTSFLVVVTLGPASIPVTVDLDAIMVTDGECCRSGRC